MVAVTVQVCPPARERNASTGREHLKKANVAAHCELRTVRVQMVSVFGGAGQMVPGRDAATTKREQLKRFEGL